MIIVNTPGTWKYVYTPLKHASWEGSTPTDLVFPFFVFIVGLSMVFSFSRIAGQEKSAIALKILRRTALIFLVGLFLNWFPFFHKNIADLRIMGVLQKIALSYGGAAFIVLYARKSWLPYITAVVLLGYWALLYGLGGEIPYGLDDNIVRTVDLKILGESHLYGGFGIPFDPEGLLSCLPSIGTVLLGYIFGSRILAVESKSKLIQEYTIAGALLVGAGLVWGMSFPIIKALWTSSYVLYTAGLALLVFAILIYVIDVAGWKKWAYPFRVFGLNPLLAYALSGLVFRLFIYVFKFDGTHPYKWAYEHFFNPTFGNYFGSFFQAFTYMALIWFFSWLLYRKNIVIKL
ncbi:membrane protein [Portibacter lacus]|uniref:Membrane protein n=2 Tax=Portibacter lacus TaxID=1099794 RepID=A0AA37WEW0_9BACT|nr:membrane protein [Portibacter lacus]